MGRLSDFYDYLQQDRKPEAEDLWRYRHLTITPEVEEQRKRIQAQKPSQTVLAL